MKKFIILFVSIFALSSCYKPIQTSLEVIDEGTSYITLLKFPTSSKAVDEWVIKIKFN